MFGRKKSIKTEEKIIESVNSILQDPSLKKEERAALIRMKKRLQKGAYMPRVVNDFLSELRDLALQSKLTPQVGKLYTDIINNAYTGTGWSGIRFME